jgi:ABC-2 type transport system permease protein
MTTSPTTPTQPVREESLHSVLSARTRPSRPSALSASLTFGWRALLKIKHVPEQLFDVTAFPIMFTLIFTYLFGGALAGSTNEYLHYLLPGILVQTVVFITIYTGLGLNTDITKGVSTASDRCQSGARLPSSEPCSVTQRATRWHRRW